MFLMLFPLKPQQEHLYRHGEGKRSFHLWRTVMALRLQGGGMLDTSVCIKVLPGGGLLVWSLRKDKEASKSV